MASKEDKEVLINTHGISHLDRSPLNMNLGDSRLGGRRGELLAFKLPLHSSQTTRQGAGLSLIHHLSAKTQTRN